MTPADLNETSNEELFAIVDDAAGAGHASSSMEHQPFAPYVTLELLSRVHERVVQLKASRATTLSKHKLLARAVLRLTGVPVPPDDRDVDKIGNHLDIWLQRRYVEADRRSKRNIRNAVTREEQRAQLRLTCCSVTGWGGVEEYHHIVPEALDIENLRGRGAHNTPVPYVPYTRQLTPAAMTVLQLKVEVNEARSHATSASALLERERERVAAAKRRREDVEAEVAAAKKLVAITMKEKLQVEKQAAAHLKAQGDAQRAESRRLKRESAQALRDAQAAVLRLGSQAAAHARDATLHAQKEAAVQQELQAEREQAELHVKELKQHALHLQSQLSSTQREAAKALRDAEAKVLRLGGQAAAHAQEAAHHAQEKFLAQQKLDEQQERAELELEKVREQTKELRARLSSTQRDAARALQKAEGKVLQLSSQAAARAQEAAIEAQKAEEAKRREDDAKEELKEAHQETEYYREKAATEAQTRRDRAKLCAVVLAQKEAIKSTSTKRLRVRKELEDQLENTRSSKNYMGIVEFFEHEE